jgi:hypothetical protein
MIATIYYASIAGSEAIYQLLIICPVIPAMLLPSNVILGGKALIFKFRMDFKV